LARRTRRIRRCAEARLADCARRSLLARSRDVLLGGVVFAARRYDDVLSRRSDLCDGTVGAAAARAGRLAPLDRGTDRLWWCRGRAAAILGELHRAGPGRADRPHPVRAL